MVTQEGEISFRGQVLRRFRSGRQVLLLAHQVGLALGYERGGRTLLDKVTGGWASELDAAGGRYVLESSGVTAFDQAFPGVLREITSSRNPYRVVFLNRAGLQKLAQWANVERRSGLQELRKLCALPAPVGEPDQRQLSLPDAPVPVAETRDTLPESDEDSAARRGRPGAVLVPLESEPVLGPDAGQEEFLRRLQIAGPEPLFTASPESLPLGLASPAALAEDAGAAARAVRLQIYLVNAQTERARAQTEHARALADLESARALRLGQQIALAAARAGITDAENAETVGDLVDCEPLPDGFRRATGLLNDFGDPGLALATIDAIVRSHLGRVLAPADVVRVPVQRSGDDARTSWVRAYSRRAANLIRQAVPAYLTPLDGALGTARQREYNRRRVAAGLPAVTHVTPGLEDLTTLASLAREDAGRVGEALHTARCRFWRRNPRDPDSEILVSAEFVARFLGRPLEKAG